MQFCLAWNQAELEVVPDSEVQFNACHALFTSKTIGSTIASPDEMLVLFYENAPL